MPMVDARKKIDCDRCYSV